MHEMLSRHKRFFVRLFAWNLPPLNLNVVSKWKETKENKVLMHSMLNQTTIYKQDKGWFI